MDKDLEIINKTLLAIKHKDLPSALEYILPYIDKYPFVYSADDIREINENFNMMVNFYEKGVKDPMAKNMYSDMLNRLGKSVRNIRTDYKKRNIEFYKDASSHVDKNMPMSEKAIRIVLENFVSDEAMLQFQPEEKRKETSYDLYSKHYSFMQSLFCYIVVSDLWTTDQAEAMTDIILSPTIDSSDAQMIVSAIMLSTMNSFDINKFHILTEVYKKASDEVLRQKALVGWALSMTDEVCFKEQSAYIHPLCDNPDTAKEIIDLQKQIIYCMNADKDNEVIQRDIIPTIMRNSNLDVNHFGITEKDDSTLQDILDPNAQDRAMEESEEKFKQMIEMQKNGADVYFGGFSKMKRFPFFYVLSNWFCPFNINHPVLYKAYDDKNHRKFLSNLLAAPLFCDSDKYSFAIALASVISKLPSNMREMMGSDEMFGRMPRGNSSSRNDIRRKVIQDLYRFSRLYRWNEQIYNPFSKKNCLFISSKLMNDTPIRNSYMDFGYFLNKRSANLFEIFIPQLCSLSSCEAYILIGIHYMKNGRYDLANNYFKEVLRHEPDNKKAQLCYAKSCYKNENFKEAYNYYSKNYNDQKDNKMFSLEYAVTLIGIGRYEEASNILFKLDFDYPDDLTIKRVLAWNMMEQKKLEQAEKEYAFILNSNKNVPADFLNAGYCQWFKGNIEKATSLFCRFCKATDKDHDNTYKHTSFLLSDEFLRDSKILKKYKINDFDETMALSITHRKVKRN